MIDPQLIALIKKDLPVGFPKILQERIHKKTSILFSPDYIRRVLNPDDRRYNEIIIDEAIMLRKELLQKRSEQEASILQGV